MIVVSLQVSAQNWTEPVNVSNISGLDSQPAISIDNNGIYHCVWVNTIETNYRIVYYSQSEDNGLSWTTPENVSQNTEKWLSHPHIVCDSENNLHLTYDYNVGNSSETLIYYKKYNGINWSEAFIVSENWPGSRGNKLIIDHNDRIYCTWFLDYNNGTGFYRYLENGEWSDVFIPYDNNDYHSLSSCTVDSDNNLHWIGSHHYNGQNHYNDHPIYFYYDYENDLWSDIIEFGEYYSNQGFDIDLDFMEMPHLVYHQYTNSSPPLTDGTFYTYKSEDIWSNPELIVEDPIEQHIVIDDNNNVSLFDIEKTNNGSMFIHYYKKLGNWEGVIIDETTYNTMHTHLTYHGDKIMVVYLKPFENNLGDIYFSQTDIISKEFTEVFSTATFKVYPNPFRQKVNIHFELCKEGKTIINIYNMQAKLLNTLLNENKLPGKYEIIWNGRDENGKDVSSGLYLIRLQTGRNIQTRSVEYINKMD